MKIEIDRFITFIKNKLSNIIIVLIVLSCLIIIFFSLLILNNTKKYYKFFYYDYKGNISYDYKYINVKNKNIESIVLSVLNEEILGSDNILLKNTFDLSGKIYNVYIHNKKLIINCNKDFVNDNDFERNLILMQSTIYQNFNFINEIEFYIENEFYREINKRINKKNNIFNFFY